MTQPEQAQFDLAVIGGGINGAGIARDAAGRGLRALLIEQNDLASGTSSASTKLIHGGLRYLEHGAFRLVREALIEREVLWRLAPHIIWPLRFVLPVQADRRSPLLLRLGLFLYDHIGGRKILPSTRKLDLALHPAGEPLKQRDAVAFEYSDCWVDDSRLVILNAVDAAERGASIRTRTACVRAERGDIWRLTLESRERQEAVTASVLVNASGPWIGAVSENVLRINEAAPVRLVKGSHIVVRRLFDHDSAYIFQNTDGRIVFALPYERDFTLLGTTDEDFDGDPASVAPSPAEIAYLCKTATDYFSAAISPADIVWSFAGVRSLYDDGSAQPKDTTRDYHLVFEEGHGLAPLLNVYGGKITTYRRLAEAALAQMSHVFAMRPAWTVTAPLPGGDFPCDAVDARIAAARDNWPFLTEDHARRLVRAYGTRIGRVLRSAKTFADLGMCFGADLTEAEVGYLMSVEWAREPDDILWRRSKIGLHFDAHQRAALGRFMATIEV